MSRFKNNPQIQRDLSELRKLQQMLRQNNGQTVPPEITDKAADACEFIERALTDVLTRMDNSEEIVERIRKSIKEKLG